MNILGALVWFYMSACFIGLGVMGVINYRKSVKTNHPFVALKFAMLPIVLPACLGFAILFVYVGVKIISQH